MSRIEIVGNTPIGYKNKVRWILVCLLQIPWLIVPGIANSAITSSNNNVLVLRVVDGDTVKARKVDGEIITVRLAQIDAPEMDQPGGKASTDTLADLVAGKNIRIEADRKDRYGRYIATMFAGDTDVNRALVETGNAWAYRRYLEDESILRLEADARQLKKGLWADEGPVPPWDWRRGKRGIRGERDLESLSGFCGQKRYCSQMSNCEEAQRFFSQCGLASLDGDKDGIPCETLCQN